MTDEHRPASVIDGQHALVVASKEIAAGSPDVFQPTSFEEWQGQQRTSTVLAAWSDQMTHERSLREKCATWVFLLVGLQVLLTFGIIIAQGAGLLSLDNELIKILIPVEAAEILGLALIVIKYLFSKALRTGLDGLVGVGGKDEA